MNYTPTPEETQNNGAWFCIIMAISLIAIVCLIFDA